MAEYVRLLRTAHDLFLKKLSDETTRKRVLLAMLKKKKRIFYNAEGTQLNWKLRFKQLPVEGVDELEVLNFVRTNTLQQAVLDWKELVLRDAISSKEIKLGKKSKTMVLSTYKDVMKTLKGDWSAGFSDKLFLDGNASGNTKLFMGLESWFADDNATANADAAAAPSDTYAGLSTIKGNYGDTTADAWYGWNSPYLANSGYNSNTWDTNPDKIMRRVRVNTTFGNDPDEMIDIILLNQASYIECLNWFDSHQRVIVERGDKNALTDMGFVNFQFEGTPVSWDQGVPATYSNPGLKTMQGYGLNFNHLALLFAEQDDICEGTVFYDEDQRVYKVILETLGQLQCDSVRSQAKIATYA